MLKDRHPYKRLMFFNKPLRFEREITVFPALAQTYTKNDDTSDLDAGVGESVGFMERSGCGTE